MTGTPVSRPTRPGEARIGHGTAGLPADVDVLVVGLGVTGAGVALDAATRGLSTLAVDAHDVAFGTSRWSSKLVHGGLRYLAQGQVGIAHESAVERRLLLEVTAPHLTRPLPFVLPLTPAVPRGRAAIAHAGLWAGDLLRRATGTSGDLLPPPRRISAREALLLAPGLRRGGLRGGLLYWDGQLEDDARLVITLARTAAAYGATVRTRCRVVEAGGRHAVLVDPRTGDVHRVRARAVVNAAGVWAGDLVPEVALRPSRGSHLVVRAAALPGTRSAVTVPVPGSSSRYAMVLPRGDGTIHVGLTDEPVSGPVPDVPTPAQAEIDDLLSTVGAAFERPLHRGDVIGTFAGLRPLLAGPDRSRAEESGGTADLSRRHAVHTSADGVVTIVGGKLTTYRRMAADAVDATGLADGRCVTARLALLGAGRRSSLDRLAAPPRLVRRFGTEAGLVLESARAVTGLADAELLAPIADPLEVTLAELVFGVTHEGAVDVDDLLDRRTRVGLVPADREAVVPAARRALDLAAAHTAG